MPLFFIYLLKLSISLALVYLFYQLLLRKLTFYNCNRWYLAGYSFMCFFFALINIGPLLRNNNWENIEFIQWLPVIEGTQKATATIANGTAAPVNYWQIAAIIILAGVVIMLARVIIQLLSLRRI